MADHPDPGSVFRILLYGSPETRRALAEGLRGSDAAGSWAMLAETVRAPGSLLLRARCLEALGMSAAGGDERTAEAVLAALLGDETPAAPRAVERHPEG